MSNIKPLVSIRTRYFPGVEEQKLDSEKTLDSATGDLVAHPYRRDGRPSAMAQIVLNGKPDKQGYSASTVWRKQDFVGDTPEEVKRLVEEWVQARLDEVRSLLGVEGGGD